MADNLAPAPRPGGKPGESLQAQASAGTAAAPPNASAAPTPASIQTGTGLCAAINAYYADLANKQGFIPDVYEIYFADPLLENASMVPAGPIEKEFTGTAPSNAASAKLPEKQNAPLNIRSRGTTAGQQIVQFIDQVMRSSRYIGDQQNVIWNTKTNSWDPQGKPGQVFAWYNIVGNAVQLQYDPARNDHAYRIIYTITPYQTPIQSEYFASGDFRGVHKVYNYWFTGQNTQVLQYEQNFNSLWTQAITGATTKLKNQLDTSTFLSKKSFLPTSNQARPGGTGKTFEPGANAADILYTQDYANIKLNIIGDPAWIPAIIPLTKGKFNTSPFNPDGSVNVTASVPYFKFAWNRAVDYNLETGLMDTGANNYRNNFVQAAGEAQESVAYILTSSRSSFKSGKFTQELTGTAFFNTNTSIGTSLTTSSTGKSDIGRNTDPAGTTTVVNSVASTVASAVAGAVAGGGGASRVTDNNVISSLINSSNPLQAGVAKLKEAATAALSTAATNFLRPYEQQLTDTVNGYAKSAGNWLESSITSISGPKPLTPVPPASIVAAVGQTNEFGGFEAPPTLSGKPGENGLGGVDYASSGQGGQPPVTDPLPEQGIVQDDQYDQA